MAASADKELLERQINELYAVQAMFSQPGELSMEEFEQAVFVRAQQITSEPSSSRVDWDAWTVDMMQLSGRVTLPGVCLSDAPVRLKFTLPGNYPVVSPILQVYSATLEACRARPGARTTLQCVQQLWSDTLLATVAIRIGGCMFYRASALPMSVQSCMQINRCQNMRSIGKPLRASGCQDTSDQGCTSD